MASHEHDRFSGTKPLHEIIEHARSEVGVDVKGGLPYQLIPRVTQTFARPLIHVEDRSIILPVEKECVGSMIHKHLEPFLASTERLLGPLEVGDVDRTARKLDGQKCGPKPGAAIRTRR
jgi:hypothetical protein